MNIAGSYKKNDPKFNKIKNSYALDDNSFSILYNILPGLKQIYTLYFTYEISNHTDIAKIKSFSFNAFVTFCKEFQFLPYLIPRHTLEMYWEFSLSSTIEELINNAQSQANIKLKEKQFQLGTVFTLPKFILFFSHLSTYYYDNIEEQLSNAEKLLYLIERIYRSKGYNDLNKKSNIPCNKKLTLIPSKAIIARINSDLLKDNNSGNSSCNSSNSSNSGKHIKNRFNSKWYVDIKTLLNLNDNNYNRLQPYLEQLRNLFGIYSKIGNKLQYGKMSFTNYQKMLIDGGLLHFNRRYRYRSGSCNTSVNNGKRKLNLSIYENNSSLGRVSHGVFNFNLNTSINNNNNNSNTSKLLSKSLSQQMLIPFSNNNKNIFDTSSILITHSQRKFSLEPPKNKTKLSISDINLIYSKVSGYINYNTSKDKFKTKISRDISLNESHLLNMSSYSKNIPFKLDFYLFMKTFPLIALRFYPNDKNDINESMNMFIEHKFISFIEKVSAITKYYSDNNEMIEMIKQVSQNESLIEVNKDISPLIMYYYNYYAECIKGKKVMTFEKFVLFFKEFNIYPQWMSLVNLKEVFYGQTCRMKVSEEVIEFKLFMECLIVIAVCMNSGDDFKWCDKVLFMVDKMFGDGGSSARKRRCSGYTFSEKKDFAFYEKKLMKKYPEYYKKKYEYCDERYEKVFFNVQNENNNNNNNVSSMIEGEIIKEEIS